MFKTDILFTGFYGYTNTGDDAFVEVASWGANEIWNKSNIRFLAKNNQLPITVNKTKAYPFKIARTYSKQMDLLLSNTSYLISAGGSTIHSKMVPTNPKEKAIKLKKFGKSIKIGGIGVSIGPFKTVEDEKAVIEYLKQIDFLALRDKASFDFVSSLSLPYAPIQAFDLAALLPDIYNYNFLGRKMEKNVIGVSVCNYESFQNGMDKYLEKKRNLMIVDLIKKLDLLEDLHFKFYVINGNEKIGDRNLTIETIKLSQPKSFEIIEYNKETQLIWKSISDCDFIISTRLHAAIFACFSNTPFMLNEYHRKCGDFLNDVGYEKSYRLYNSNYDIDEKAMQIIEILNGNSYIKPKFLDETKELAKLNFTKITL